MLKRLNHISDEMIVAQALIYFVFIGAIAIVATIVAHSV